MSQTTTPLGAESKNMIMDVRQKLQTFSGMDEGIRKLKKQDVPKHTAMQAVLDATNLYMTDIIDDSFKQEWDKYSLVVRQKAEEILKDHKDRAGKSSSSGSQASMTPVIDSSLIALKSLRSARAQLNESLSLSAYDAEFKVWNEMSTNERKDQNIKKPSRAGIGMGTKPFNSVIHAIDKILEDMETNLSRFTSVDGVSTIQERIQTLRASLSGVPVSGNLPTTTDIAPFSNAIIEFANQVENILTDLKTSQVRFTSNKNIDFDAVVAGNTDREEFVYKTLTIQEMYKTLGGPLVATVNKVATTLKSYVKYEGSDDASSPETIQQAKNALRTLETIGGRLMLTVNDTAPMPELKEGIDRTVTSIALGRALTEFVPLPDDAPAALHNKRLWSSVNKAASASADAGGSFMYRAVDPIRVMKYLDQIKRFRDVVSKAEIGAQVLMQKKRMQQVNSDIVRQAAELRSKMDPPVGEADDVVTRNVTEASIRIRQLAKKKRALITSFIRTVRSAVATFSKQMVSFVQQKHGDAIRYMAYWELVGKDSVASADLRDAIKQHNDMVMEIGEMGRRSIMEQAYSPFMEGINGMIHDSDVSALSLDDAVVMVLETERDHTLVWMEKQADRVHGAFLRGSPSLMDELFEPQQLVLWFLKALRIGIAAVSIDVATRAYRGVYKRRVHELDQAPPGPWVFIAMFLALDATIHLLILAVLFTLFKMLKAPDNDFPIDMDLIARWGMDYLACTLMVLAISFGIGYIIQNKRYFRFRHEGDRAIRAFAKMVFYVYVVAVFIPFYRMSYG